MYFDGESLCDHTLLHQLLAVDSEHVRMLSYAFVHQGLREHWLVELVVAVSSVPYDVYHYVVVELCSVSSTYRSPIT